VIRVLIADDNAVIRQGVSALLGASDSGIEVVGQAATGREAIEQAHRHHPDVVLLDIEMPIMDGVQAASELAGEHGVLMLTYSYDERRVSGAIRAGAVGYLVHGRFEPDELIRAVHEVAAGRPVLSPAVAPAVFEVLRRGPAREDEGDGRFALTEREREIMGHLVDGSSNREIGERLFLTEKTVKNHLHRIYMKLGVHRRSQAIARWLGTERESHK